jgi:two-component system, LytTR family, response regulator
VPHCRRIKKAAKKWNMNFIKIPYDGGIRLVQAELIIRVKSISNYSKIYFAGSQPMTVAKVLHWFEDRLPIQLFTRVHRSHLVNKMFIDTINNAANANLVLTNGEHIPISRRRKMLVKKW